MSSIQPDVDLSVRNTLAIPSRAQWLVEVRDAGALPELVRWARERQLPIRALGGGSNLLLNHWVSGLVVDLKTTGRSRIGTEPDGCERWRFMAGETWHQVVRFSVEQGLSGLENLALIPGSVGAAPIQNIGAYGVELSDVLVRVEAYDTEQMAWKVFDTEACCFGYRDSLFKQRENRYIVTAIDLRLSREFRPVLHYGPLQALREQPELTAAQVMQTVIDVRRAKLPDPDRLPNAGSFFKNPIVSESRYQALKTTWPDLVAYPANGGWKLAAGWMIDRCGLKGRGNAQEVGCYEKQALVLVNPRRADYDAVNDWQREVQRQVRQRFGVALEREPRYWS